MSHPFGDLISQYLHRKHGLSQARLAGGILQPPSVISEMCQGKRLTGPQARGRVIAIAGWLAQQGALETLDEADRLLDAAGMSALREGEPVEAALMRGLAPSAEPRRGQLPAIDHATPHAARLAPRHNLPAQLTPFVGREGQIAGLAAQIGTTRLLTLTGAGGVGKTRLALEVAARGLDQFADGAWFVDLAPVTNPDLAPATMADVLRLPVQPGGTIEEALTAYLEARRLLLILDNCEHLLGACARLAERILRVCPSVHLLVTGREALRIGGETAWRVASLTRPAGQADGRRLKVADLEQYEAVRLFVQRARAVRPDFALTAQNATAVAQICSRLDGIPLALEMAAARVSAMTAEEIATRLAGAFDARPWRLLTSGTRTAPPRQQTLLATMEWGYALLAPAERTLLARLSQFAGGWNAEAAEAIADLPTLITEPGTANILDLLAQLVGKSFVIADQEGGETRYRMLEPVRQFAADQLRALDEVEVMRDRHLNYFLALAEQPPLEMLAGSALSAKMRRLHDERDNLRQALEWAHLRSEDGVLALRLAGALWYYWYSYGYHSEGIAALQGALAKPAHNCVAARGRATVGQATIMWGISTDGMAAFAEEGLRLCRQAGDRFGVAYALVLLGEAARRKRDYARSRSLFEEGLHVARESGSPEAIWNTLYVEGFLLLDLAEIQQAGERFEESIALAQATEDPRYLVWPVRSLSCLNPSRALALCQAEIARQAGSDDFEGRAMVLHAYGTALMAVGDYASASRAFAESLSLWEGLGVQWHWAGGASHLLWELGKAAWLQGQDEAAVACYAESLRIFREVGDNEMIALVQAQRGCALLAQDDPASARSCFQESLSLVEVTGGHAGLNYAPIMLAGLGDVLDRQGNRLQAAQLFGAAESHGSMLSHFVPRPERVGYERLMTAARARRDDPAFAAAWAAGRAMAIGEVIAVALAVAAEAG